jgi:hypothetical protein
MIGISLALIVIGVVMLFLIPWVGVPVGIVGLVLAVLALGRVGRRMSEPTA